VRLDTCFTQLHPDVDGRTRVTLADPAADRRVTVWMDATHQFVMVYTGDTLADPRRRRRSLAVEPMTCAPDAFNSGLGLRLLQPGEESVHMWGISAWRNA